MGKAREYITPGPPPLTRLARRRTLPVMDLFATHFPHGQLDGAALARTERVEGRERARCHPTDLAAAGLVAGAPA